MSKIKTYQQYKDDAASHNNSIISKYGAPPEARPPTEYNVRPSTNDTQFKRMAFTKKRTLEGWNPSDRPLKDNA